MHKDYIKNDTVIHASSTPIISSSQSSLNVSCSLVSRSVNGLKAFESFLPSEGGREYFPL